MSDSNTDERIAVVRCKDCEFYEENVFYKGLIMVHHECRRWANGCATDPNGYCFLGKRKVNEYL